MVSYKPGLPNEATLWGGGAATCRSGLGGCTGSTVVAAPSNEGAATMDLAGFVPVRLPGTIGASGSGAGEYDVRGGAAGEGDAAGDEGGDITGGGMLAR